MLQFLAAHPLLTGAMGFILGQFSLLLVLGLCGSAASRGDDSFARRPDDEMLDRSRRGRLRAPSRTHLQAT